MRKTTYVVVAAGALILAGIAGRVNPSNLPVEAKASTSIDAQIDITEDIVPGEIVLDRLKVANTVNNYWSCCHSRYPCSDLMS